MRYLLIKDKKVVNVVLAEPEKIARIAASYDEYVLADTKDPANPGDGYVDGEVIPQPIPGLTQEER